MNRLLSLITLWLIAIGAFAQGTMQMETAAGDSSIQVNHQPVPASNVTVLIVPFEPKLYNSDLDREIAMKTGEDFATIRDKFRQSLNDALYVTLDKNFSVISLLNGEDIEAKADLKYVHNSVAYQYRPVPVVEEPEVEEGKMQQLIGKAKKAVKPKPEPEPQAGIYGGQVVAPWQQGEKYMHTSVINPNMIPFLAQKYNVDYIVFVNQLDMKTAMTGDYRLYQAGDYQRKVKVHFTILDRYGNEVAGGAATDYMSSKLKQVELIERGPMRKACQQILDVLPTQPPVERALPQGVQGTTNESTIQDY